MKSLTKYVVFSIITLLAYTVISQIIFWQTGAEYGTLTACFFAAFGGEILMCALIKIFKLKDSGNHEPPEEPETQTFTTGYVSEVKQTPVETPTYTYTTSTTEEEAKG